MTHAMVCWSFGVFIECLESLLVLFGKGKTFLFGFGLFLVVLFVF